ncbi:tetratricopeptide repeat protein [Thioclava sp. FR2]|uniref:tetratricopeptide repeat protein n=1 Tax=Thioclava sp. FR2 TaxID=3445780 RepID=UPI003EB7682D
MQGKGAEALDVLNAALSKTPDYLPYSVKQSVALRALGRTAEAITLLEQRLKLHPNDLGLRDEYAVCLRLAGKADLSLEVIDQTLTVHPRHRAAILAKTDALVALGRATEALHVAQEARDNDPGYLPFLLKTASALRVAGRAADAVALLEAAHMQHPENQAIEDELCIALRLGGYPQRSLDIAQCSLAKRPQHIPTVLACVDAMISLGRGGDALETITAARQDAPRHLALAIKHASVLRILGRGKDGVEILLPFLTEQPDHLGLSDELAFCWRQSGEAERSLRMAEETLARRPAYIPALTSRIDTLIPLGRVDEALAQVQAARRTLPKHLPFIIRHATILRSLGRPDEAVPIIEEELALSPKHLALRDELAICLRLSGETDQSLALALETLEAHPMHLPARLTQIDSLLALGHLDHALEAAEAALELAPDHLPFLIKYAAILRSFGRSAEAVKVLEPKLVDAPDNPSLRDELGRCYRQIGSDERTLELIEETLSLRPGHRAAIFARIETLVSIKDHTAIEKLGAKLAEHLAQATDSNALTQGEIEALAKIVPHLGPEVAARLLKSATASLLAAAPILSPLTLWVVYRTADQIGLGARFSPLLADLMARPKLMLTICEEMLKRLFRIGYPEIEKIAQVLKGKLLAQDQFVFQLGFAELMDGAEGAILSRDRRVVPKTPSQVLVLAQMLMRAGRTKSALRYTQYARRRWPWHLQLFVLHLDCLFWLGRTEELRRVVSRTDIGRLDFRVAAARALLKVDDGSAGVELAKTLDPGTFRFQMDQDLLRYHLRRGETKEAEALYGRVRAGVPLKVASHYGPELDGTVMVDLNLAEREGSGADHKTMVPKAGAVIAHWMKSGAAFRAVKKTPVPFKVMQYWDKAEPPEDIANLMKAWEGAPAVSYSRFDRRKALDWLANTLGDEWRAALRAARSPAEESDYFRLAYLMIEGGLYVDSDDRLSGNLAFEMQQTQGLTVFVEQEGAIGNNIIFAPALHPAIVWAAHAAKVALLERHNDNTWVKTGPGLLTRAVAWYLSEHEGPHDITLKRRHDLGTWVQIHVPLPYKRTTKYWNASGAAVGAGSELADQADKLLRGSRPEALNLSSKKS